MRFEDYHRTIIGYHGTRLSVAQGIINRSRDFKYSRNADDWLGHGIYFWEYAPQQALWWARRRAKRQKWNEPIAILGSMIRLGFCFDLLDPYNVRELKKMYEAFAEIQAAAGQELPKNKRHYRFLDCAVFQFAYALIDDVPGASRVDSARAMYVPTDDKLRVWPGSWISNGAHIQLCVRNPSCILGTWLHSTEDLVISDVDTQTTSENAAITGEPHDTESGQTSSPVADQGPNSTTREGQANDPSGS
jgi:hypothetical protein